MPKGKMVKLHMRSRDVLHAALLPHFRAQMYCVPGTPTQFSLEPLYTTEEYREKINKPDFNFELACNQICGVSHYAMRREIIVVEETEYLSLLGSETPAMAGMEFPAPAKLTMKHTNTATK
jgi:cytochrome c oxidase subunit 2